MDDKNLSIPDVDLSKMNSDQKFAIDIVLKWIHNYIENPDEFEPLRMIVSSTLVLENLFLLSV
jgi:predicted nuclease of restriction endonuclease-like RecB superfamily